MTASNTKTLTIGNIVKARRRASTFTTKRNIYKQSMPNTAKSGIKKVPKVISKPVDEYQHKINIVLVGNGNVGKTSLLFKLAHGAFSDPYIPSTGVDFLKVIVHTHNDQKILVKFWDTSGDIRSKDAIASQVYPLASGFIVMYDVTDVQSYNDVFYWMKLLDKYALDNAKVVIIGNKRDLRTEQDIKTGKHLTKVDGMKAALSYKVKFMETSVLSNHNVVRTIRRMVSNIIEAIDVKEVNRVKKNRVRFAKDLKDIEENSEKEKEDEK